MFLLSFFALGIPAYRVANYDGPKFGVMILLYAADLYAWEALAQVFSVQSESPLVGMMQFVQMWFTGFIFAGFLIPGEDMVWPFKAFTWILPLRWTIRGMVYNEMIDGTYEQCDLSSDDQCFGDPAAPGRQDGDDVLNSLGDVFGPFSDENTLVQDILVPLSFALLLKMAHTYLLVSKASVASSVGRAK